MLSGRIINQIAYCVDDVHKSAESHHKLFGSGPFYVSDYTSFPVNYRGNAAEISLRIAVGQWGETQVELMQSLNSDPSILNELYPMGSGRSGLHHIGVIADDLDTTVNDLEQAGIPPVMSFSIPEAHIRVVFADAVRIHGHFIELMQTTPKLVERFDMVKRAAVDFDGRRLIREMVS